jgi:hypothetical protein
MPKIVRVTKTEFELDNGTVCPIPFDLDETPSLESFQQAYDHWLALFRDAQLMEGHEPEKDAEHR